MLANPIQFSTAGCVRRAGIFAAGVCRGTITDADGKSVTGAVVAFENAETKNHVEVKSDKKGHYITNMKPGYYAVTVTVDGRLRELIRQYYALGGHGDPLDIKLKPGW